MRIMCSLSFVANVMVISFVAGFLMAVVLMG